jgi:Ca-activated chloride channel family protein
MPWTDAFARPQVLAALAIVPLVALWGWHRQSRRPALVVAALSRLPPLPRSPRARLRHAPVALRLLALAALVVGAAGPLRAVSPLAASSDAREILLAVDTSDSMMAEDFAPNRLESAKRLMDEFVRERRSDRIGLLVFAGEALLVCPATLDHERLRRFVAEVRPGAAGDGTALGLAVASGVARLRTSATKGRVLLLLTDGVSTRDGIDLLDAGALAAREGLRVHAIGVGSEGPAPYPVGSFRELVSTRLDEPSLRALAGSTGGRFFRASDDDALRAVFREIDGLERSRVEEARYGSRADDTATWLLAGALLLAAEAALSATLLRVIP